MECGKSCYCVTQLRMMLTFKSNSAPENSGLALTEIHQGSATRARTNVPSTIFPPGVIRNNRSRICGSCTRWRRVRDLATRRKLVPFSRPPPPPPPDPEAGCCAAPDRRLLVHHPDGVSWSQRLTSWVPKC